MQYTKPMIDLVFRIRKTAPAHLKSAIKLADPNLFDRLAQEYPQLTDRELRHNIVQLMALAGPAWLALIDRDSEPRVDAPFDNKSAGTEIITTRKSASKSMMYRGQKLYS